MGANRTPDSILYSEIVAAVGAWFAPGAPATVEAIEAVTRWYHAARRAGELVA